MIKTNGFRVLAMVMTNSMDGYNNPGYRCAGSRLSWTRDLIYQASNGTVNVGTGCRSRHGFCNDPYRRGPGTGC